MTSEKKNRELKDEHYFEAGGHLKENKQIFIDAIESLPHPFYVIDAKDYRILIANSAARVYGNIIDGIKCHELTHNRNSPCSGKEHNCPLSIMKKTKKPVAMEHIHYDSNNNPKNYFAEVEQAAFSPANFVPGIAASPDKMLQGRLFSYHDTHIHRLGHNYQLLPINRPKAAKVNYYQRDGFMNFMDNGGDSPNYYPNSFGGPEPKADVAEPEFEVSGQAARQPYTHPNDDFFQAGELYRRVMNDKDKEHLIGNITTHLCNAQKRIQLRQTANFYKADGEYGSHVAAGLGIDAKEVKKLAEMSQEERAKATA